MSRRGTHAARSSSSWLADQLLERRLAADRLEVGVSLGVAADVVRGELHRAAKVCECLLLAAREAVDACSVVVQHRPRSILRQLGLEAVRDLLVLARLVER